MTIDPKTSAWMNIIVGILGLASAFAAQLTTLFGSGTADQIVSIAGIAIGIIGVINGGLHGVSSPKAGPLVQ